MPALYRDDEPTGPAFFRGVMWGLVFAVPFWSVLIGVSWLVTK